MIIGQYLPFCVYLLYCVCLFLTKYHPYIYFCGHNLLYPFLILLLTQRYAFFQVALDCSCMWLRSWLAGKEKRLLKYVNNNKKACLLFVCERKHNWKCLGTNTYLFFILPSYRKLILCKLLFYHNRCQSNIWITCNTESVLLFSALALYLFLYYVTQYLLQYSYNKYRIMQYRLNTISCS